MWFLQQALLLHLGKLVVKIFLVLTMWFLDGLSILLIR